MLFWNAVSCFTGPFFFFFLLPYSIPLVQSQQKFYSMDFDLRSILKPSVEKSADRFG